MTASPSGFLIQFTEKASPWQYAPPTIVRKADPRGYFLLFDMRTAFLVDGGFFLYRYRRLKGNASPQQVARDLHCMCLEHLRKLKRRKHSLYRIFYYDCPPLTKKAHNPVDESAVDFSKTSTAQWRWDFFEELRKRRKVALRLGYLDEANGHWIIKDDSLKSLMRRQITRDDLRPENVKYEVRQKGVDMKLGLDIATLAYKNLVDQIVLISGDRDFVAAAKLARREGIDFILDPMWHRIRDDLHEHIDGLQTVFSQPSPRQNQQPASNSGPSAGQPPEASPQQS